MLFVQHTYPLRQKPKLTQNPPRYASREALGGERLTNPDWRLSRFHIPHFTMQDQNPTYYFEFLS